MTAGLIILILKIAVGAVTLLWLGSMFALFRGHTKLHGRINIAFFALTLAALVGLELIVKVVSPGLVEQHLAAHQAEGMLRIHLCFSLPAAVLLFFMLFTGLRHMRNLHIAAGVLFSVLWIGTFITGVFFLPHETP
jgi:hypothetical protein